MKVKVVSFSTGILINQLIFSQNFLFEAVLYGGKKAQTTQYLRSVFFKRDIENKIN